VTDDPAHVRAIRAARIRKAEAERRHVASLTIPDPEPSAVVLRHARVAEEQRFLAKQAVERRAREKYLIAAKLAEKKAEEAWERQLEAHWQAHAAAETMTLAKARGDELDETRTETMHWATDNQGVMIREGGLPVLVVETATTVRRRDGLKWLASKGRLTDRQLRIGMAFRDVCSRFAQAIEPGRSEEGGGAARSKPSTGPADWRLLAVRAHGEAERAITAVLPPPEGEEVLRLCRAVCYQGETIRDLADGNDWQAVRLEERLKLGLALLSQVLKEEK